MSGVSDPSETHGRLIAVSKVNGTTVYNTAGDKLGSVYDVMIDKRSGKAEYEIMSFGGSSVSVTATIRCLGKR
jgi:sporulation protein YlmC with PRC-barrel domain